MNPGEGLFIAPFVGHSYQSISKEEWHTCFFTLTGTLKAVSAGFWTTSRLFVSKKNWELFCERKLSA
ncbi:MAG: hypothetical protein ACLT4D_13170 [Blautia faecis]